MIRTVNCLISISGRDEQLIGEGNNCNGMDNGTGKQ